MPLGQGHNSAVDAAIAECASSVSQDSQGRPNHQAVDNGNLNTNE